jgi:hypothetical protein
MAKYRAKVQEVEAARIENDLELGELGSGKAGDYVVVNEDGELAFCPAAVFVTFFEPTEVDAKKNGTRKPRARKSAGGSVTDEVKELLRQRSLTSGELIKELGAKPGTVYGLLNYGQKRGMFRRDAKGAWSLKE